MGYGPFQAFSGWLAGKKDHAGGNRGTWRNSDRPRLRYGPANASTIKSCGAANTL